MSGGTGGDVFVFTPNGGIDTIVDFENGAATMNLQAFPFNSIDDIIAAGGTIVADGPNTVITLGTGGPQIVLLGTAPADVDPSDFVF